MLLFGIFALNIFKFDSVASKIMIFDSTKNIRKTNARSLETYNFHKELVKLGYFYDTNVVNFYENDTKISGAYGEIWNTLAYHLNFTLSIINMKNDGYGILYENGTSTGLSDLLQRKKIDVLPRSSMLLMFKTNQDFTVQFWDSSFHFYVHPAFEFNEFWFLKFFDVQTWYSILFCLTLLGIFYYLRTILECRVLRSGGSESLNELFTFITGVITNQTNVSSTICNRSKIAFLTTTFFCWILYSTFSSNAIKFLTDRSAIYPFVDLEDFITNTDYSVILHGESTPPRKIKEMATEFYTSPSDSKRFIFQSNFIDVWTSVCNSSKKIAAFEIDDRYKLYGRKICTLMKIPTPYFKAPIGAAVALDYKFKRSFDVGIIRLIESGLLTRIENMWMPKWQEQNTENPKPINISQISLILKIWSLGLLLSFFVLTMENLKFNTKHTRKK